MLVAYDVRADGARAKIAAILQVNGNRIQKSVFLLSLGVEELEEMLTRIEPLMDPERDSLLALRQCATCWEAAITRGQVAQKPEALCWAVM